MRHLLQVLEAAPIHKCRLLNPLGTGDLRWRAPTTPKFTTGVQQATTQPNECFQSSSGVSAVDPFRSSSISKRAVSQDEDCLFLKYVRTNPHFVWHLLISHSSVFTPGTLNPSKKLPVLVWIHGGGCVFLYFR
jgi:carboxylesterase type B